MRARRTFLAAVAATAAACFAVAPAHADSLYGGSAPRPGPDILYAPPASAPQLENVPGGPFAAPPILVSGATAYRDGEFLYQDFLFDDGGALESSDPADPRALPLTFSHPTGTYTYPTDPRYAMNAADLVEFRVRPYGDSTAFRITLNTLKDPSLVAFSIAIGSSAKPRKFPDGANVKAPAQLFLTVRPGGQNTMVAEFVHAGSGTPVGGPTPVVVVDKFRRQIHVLVDHRAWDPTGQTVRFAAGVGLWDGANDRYLQPGPTASATQPGGGSGSDLPAFFNVAFRTNEPMPNVSDPLGTYQRPAWLRDVAQAEALRNGDISPFHADVSFPALMAHVTDNHGVPDRGPMDRILASRFDNGQGATFALGDQCLSNQENCIGEYRGQLQPYAIYIPRKPPPASGYGLTLQLHSLGAGYNQYLNSNNQRQFGERGPGTIVFTPEGRGPDGFYTSYAGADTFEVWADIARRYHLNPNWTVITGYSMGGIGTFKLAERFPDLFARAHSTVGDSPDNNMVPSLRNVPIVMWNMAVNELVPAASYLPTAQALDDAAYRYELDVFAPGEHLTLAINDQYDQASHFLGTHKVNRNPPHVTFVIDPSIDYPALGFVADHAYWLSRIRAREGGQGTIDAFSHGFGRGDPTPTATQFGAGSLTGGTIPAIGFTRQFRTWSAPPVIAQENRLDIDAHNIRSVTVHPERAHLDCFADVQVTTDGPITVHLAGCGRAVNAGGG